MSKNLGNILTFAFYFAIAVAMEVYMIGALFRLW